jgi:hypothetical protein
MCYNIKGMIGFLGSRRETIGWLLEKDNPSVRYLTLTEILARPQKNAEVQEAKAAIMATGVIPKILAKQRPEGYWLDRQNFYIKAKYRGTVWQVILLAELFADGSDKRIRSACEFLLKHSQNKETGGFSYRSSKAGDGDKDAIIPCLTGNLTWSLIRFGYGEDPRIQKALDWITRYQRFDDGENTSPSGWPYRSEKCWGRHTCMLGIVKSLKALSEVAPENRSAAAQTCIRKATNFILKHHLFMRSHNLNVIANPDWICLGFPLFWMTDIVELIWLLVKNGIRDKRMDDAVELSLSKQDQGGRWPLEKTFNGRMLAKIEEKDCPSKWITWRAWQALQAYSRTV